MREKVDANESLRRRQIELGLPEDELLPFLCECEDRTCRAIIRLTASEYGEARISPDRCVCLEGHPHSGRVVRRGEGYVLAEEEE